MTPPVDVAVLAATGASGLVGALLVAVAVAHVLRTRREEADERRRRELTPVVHALLDGDGGPRPDVAGAPAALDDVVLGLLPQLRGADRQVLRQVLAERGVVARATADLSARAAWRRGRAATLLGAAAGVHHTAALAALLDDRSPDVRSAAARALGKAGDPAAVLPLLTSLDGDRPVPQGLVGMALLDLGTPALPALREALTTGDAGVRVLAAEVLGIHGDLAAAPALQDLLTDDGQPVELRRTAAGALGRIGSPRATEALREVLAGSDSAALRRVAAEALGRVGDPAAGGALTAGLRAPEAEVRAACADALAALGAEGQAVLSAMSGGTGPSAVAARAALDALALSRRPVRMAF